MTATSNHGLCFWETVSEGLKSDKKSRTAEELTVDRVAQKSKSKLPACHTIILSNLLNFHLTCRSLSALTFFESPDR